MEMQSCKKPSFAVIGKEGSTADGAAFVKELWRQANAHFDEVSALAVRNGEGRPALWGAMTDFSRRFAPWEDGFFRGLYLAGVEVPLQAQPPEGWVKWVLPAF